MVTMPSSSHALVDSTQPQTVAAAARVQAYTIIKSWTAANGRLALAH
jgi:hypothetical protein